MIQSGQNGFLVPLYDQEFFKEKLKLLMTNERLRIEMGNHAKNSIEDFSVTPIADHYWSFIYRNNKNTLKARSYGYFI